MTEDVTEHSRLKLYVLTCVMCTAYSDEEVRSKFLGKGPMRVNTSGRLRLYHFTHDCASGPSANLILQSLNS